MEFNSFVYHNVRRNMKAYFAYFLSICTSSALFFSFSMFLFHPNRGRFKFYINAAILITEVIAYLFLFFFVFYSSSVFLKSRYKEFGVLYITGMTKRQMNKMIFLENIIINTAATGSGIIVGLVFSKIYLLLIERFFRMSSLDFYFPMAAIIITLTFFIILGIFVSFFTSAIIKEDEVLKLLKATKAPKAAPKSSSLLALFGLTLLLGCYYIALTVHKENLEKILLPVVAMAVLATYLLFAQFNIWLIKMLKKSRSFYFKKTNLLWISNLFYKIKDNSRMFFLISITSAVAFTSIGTCFAFWKNNLDSIEKRYPYDFVYSTLGKPEIAEEQTGFLEDLLKEEKYTYKKVILKTLSYEADSEELHTLISESTYRQLSDQLNLKPIEFNIGEAIYIPTDSERKSPLLEVLNSPLTIIGEGDSRITALLYDDVYVVKDALYNMVLEKDESSAIYIYQVEDWAKSYQVYNRYEEKYKGEEYSLLLSKSHIYESEKSAYGTLLFLTTFIGVIFFVASGSFIYNKFYMDEEADQKKYIQLHKIGLSYKEIKKTVTVEIGILFLLPFVVAVLHSSFALAALQNLFLIEVTSGAFLVMGSFLLVQILYYLFIRGKYLSEIEEHLME